MSEILKFKCLYCGKLTAGHFPRRGDGSMRFPRKHRIEGKVCEGSFYEAEWIEFEMKEGKLVERKNWGT